MTRRARALSSAVDLADPVPREGDWTECLGYVHPCSHRKVASIADRLDRRARRRGISLTFRQAMQIAFDVLYAPRDDLAARARGEGLQGLPLWEMNGYDKPLARAFVRGIVAQAIAVS